ncbi:MAG TPA: autotransporter outer membrane beta-barrel domain-containing protein [Alphaproteobacteria bacterium]|nr:autotransporter outer membrane beta-barrel domain-containing protein [Alphaproteobacteria bacterium]
MRIKSVLTAFLLGASATLASFPETLPLTDGATLTDDVTLRINSSGNSDSLVSGGFSQATLDNTIYITPLNPTTTTYTVGTSYEIARTGWSINLGANFNVQLNYPQAFLTFSHEVRDYSVLYLFIDSVSPLTTSSSSSYTLETDVTNALGTNFINRPLETLPEAQESNGNASSSSTDLEMDDSESAENSAKSSFHAHTAFMTRRSEQIGMTYKRGSFKENVSNVMRFLKSQGGINKSVGNISIWAAALYSTGKSKTTATTSGVSDFNEGLAFGVEYKHVPTNQHIGVGVAKGWGTSFSRVFKENRSKHWYYQVGLYHSIEPIKNLRVDNSVIYTKVYSSNERLANISTTGNTIATSKTSLNAITVGPEISYKLKFKNKSSLKPYVGMIYKHLARDSYTEKDAGNYNHIYGKKQQDTIDGYVGASLRGKIKTESYIFSGILGLTITKNFKETDASQRFTAPAFGDQTYSITPPSLGKIILSPFITLTSKSSDKRSSLSISYTANIQRERLSHEFLLKHVSVLG